jgi:hypothetical protein
MKGSRIENSPGGEVTRHVLNLFINNDFPEIEKIASTARKKRERLPDGGWKISYIYSALTEIYAEDVVSEEMWTRHLARLENWDRNYPDSITAKTALAESYIRYGWFARGIGANVTVASEDRQKLKDRLALAEAKLREVSNLPEKCPYAYSVGLDYLLKAGDDRGQFARLFDEATSVEPNFFRFYKFGAAFSMENWGGSEGELYYYISNFSKIHKGDEKGIAFLSVLEFLNGDSPQKSQHLMSQGLAGSEEWDLIQSGLKQLEEKYTVTNTTKNLVAKVATYTNRYAEAHAMFEEIGNNPDPTVWSDGEFEQRRNASAAYAETGPPEPDFLNERR